MWPSIKLSSVSGVNDKFLLTMVRASLQSMPEPPALDLPLPPISKHERQICGSLCGSFLRYLTSSDLDLWPFLVKIGTPLTQTLENIYAIFDFSAFFKPHRRRLYVFGSSVRAAVRASIRDSRGSFMFPRYLQYLLTDFRQTFVTGASWDTDDLIAFLGQKVKVQGHSITAEAHSTRRYRWVQLFLVYFWVTSPYGQMDGKTRTRMTS